MSEKEGIMKEPPEEFSDLCKDLYWFMYGLDRSGLNWDYQETMETLEPIAQLETEFEKLVRYVRIYGEYVREWIEHIKDYESCDDEDDEDPDFAPVQEAWEALSDETRKAIENERK